MCPVWLCPVGLRPVGLCPVGLRPAGLHRAGLCPVRLCPVGLCPRWVAPCEVAPCGVVPCGIAPCPAEGCVPCGCALGELWGNSGEPLPPQLQPKNSSKRLPTNSEGKFCTFLKEKFHFLLNCLGEYLRVFGVWGLVGSGELWGTLATPTSAQEFFEKIAYPLRVTNRNNFVVAGISNETYSALILTSGVRK